jgi:hypothetical protein
MFDTIFDTAATLFGLLLQAGLFGPTLIFLLGALTGCWFYRWMLKRDPAKLERWAAEAKKLGETAKDKM